MSRVSTGGVGGCLAETFRRNRNSGGQHFDEIPPAQPGNFGNLTQFSRVFAWIFIIFEHELQQKSPAARVQVELVPRLENVPDFENPLKHFPQFSLA